MVSRIATPTCILTPGRMGVRTTTSCSTTSTMVAEDGEKLRAEENDFLLKRISTAPLPREIL